MSNLIVYALMFSASVTAIPNYLIMNKLHLIDSYWAVILPAVGATLGLYLMKNFMVQVPDEMIEAAKIDGASLFQRIRYIDLPELVPQIVLMLIMSAGNLMNVGFEKVFLLQTDLNKATSDVIAVYVYQQGIEHAKYSYSTAVGLFNTVVNVILLIIVNKITSKISEDVSFV